MASPIDPYVVPQQNADDIKTGRSEQAAQKTELSHAFDEATWQDLIDMHQEAKRRAQERVAAEPYLDPKLLADVEFRKMTKSEFGFDNPYAEIEKLRSKLAAAQKMPLERPTLPPEQELAVRQKLAPAPDKSEDSFLGNVFDLFAAPSDMIMGAAGASLEHAKTKAELVAQPDDLRIAGYPVSATVAALATNQFDPTAYGAALEGAKRGWAEEEASPFTVSNTLMRRRQEYRDKAGQDVFRKLVAEEKAATPSGFDGVAPEDDPRVKFAAIGSNPTQELVDRADARLYPETEVGDALLNYPYLTELGLGVMGPDVPIVGALPDVVRGVAKATKLDKAAQAGVRAVGDLDADFAGGTSIGRMVSEDYNLDKLRGTKAGDELADLLSTMAPQAYADTDKSVRAMTGELDKMADLGLTVEQKKQVWEALDTGDDFFLRTGPPSEQIKFIEEAVPFTPEEQLYHGGPVKIDKIDPNKLQSRDVGYYGPGFYTSNRELNRYKGADGVASKFVLPQDAKTLDANVLYTQHPEQKAAVLSWLDSLAPDTQLKSGQLGGSAADIAAQLRANQLAGIEYGGLVNAYARANGYDAMRVRGAEGQTLDGAPIDVVVGLNTDKLVAREAVTTPPPPIKKEVRVQVDAPFDPAMQKAAAIGRGITEAEMGLKASVGKGKMWDPETGRLQPQRVRENYAPHASSEVEDEANRVDDLTLGLKKSNYRKGLTGSDMKRSDDSVMPDELKDFEGLYRKKLANNAPVIAKTAIFKRMDEAAKSKGYAIEYAKLDDDVKAQFLAKKKADTGVEWVDLNDMNKELSDNLRAIVSEAGSKKSNHYFLPKPLAQEFEFMARLDLPKAPIWKNLGKVLDASNTVFSKMQTLPFLGFHEVNAIGNAGLALSIMGVDAIGQWKAPLAALHAHKWDMNVAAKFQGPAGMSMAQVAQEAQRYGIVRYESLSKSDIAGKNVLQKAGDVVGKPVEVVGKMAQGSDDTLKLSVFMNFIEDASPQGLATAARKTNEWTLNYAKLSPIEKTFLTRAIPFYGWMSYAAKTGVKTALQKPDKIAAWAKTYRAWEGANASNAPYISSSVPDYLGGRSVTAPESLQPPEQQAKIQAAWEDWRKTRDIEKFSMVQTDLGPVSFLIPVVDSITGGNADFKTFARTLYPLAGALGEVAMGKLSGEALADKPGLAARVAADSYVGRHVKTYQGMYRLLTDPYAKADFALRAYVGGNMGKVGSEVFNALVDEAVLVAFPGGRVKEVNADVTFNYDKVNASKQAHDAATYKSRLLDWPTF